MQVIVCRHGDALAPEQAMPLGLSDDERPLTDQGRRDTRAAAAGLRHLLGDIRIGLMLVSPLVRSRQTADILCDYLDDPIADEVTALTPTASVETLDTTVQACLDKEHLLLIGHEPGLSRWLSWSLNRKHERLMALQTNGAALIDFPGMAEGGTGTLHWLLTGTQLRALAPRTAP